MSASPATMQIMALMGHGGFAEIEAAPAQSVSAEFRLGGFACEEMLTVDGPTGLRSGRDEERLGTPFAAGGL